MSICYNTVLFTTCVNVKRKWIFRVRSGLELFIGNLFLRIMESKFRSLFLFSAEFSAERQNKGISLDIPEYTLFTLTMAWSSRWSWCISPTRWHYTVWCVFSSLQYKTSAQNKMDRAPGHLSKNYQEAVSSLVWAKVCWCSCLFELDWQGALLVQQSGMETYDCPLILWYICVWEWDDWRQWLYRQCTRARFNLI